MITVGLRLEPDSSVDALILSWLICVFGLVLHEREVGLRKFDGLVVYLDDQRVRLDVVDWQLKAIS